MALLDAEDSLHADAASFYKDLPRGLRRTTTQAIVGECYTFFRYHFGFRQAVRWLDYLGEARKSSRLAIIFSDRSDAERCEDLLRRFDDQALSYADALSLVVAERCGAGAIFGFDHHLGLTGIPLLPGRRRRRK